jgi:hypothetical protein
MAVPKETSTSKEPSRLNSGLGEALGVLIILFLMLPFTAVCLKATTEIVKANCEVNNGR